MRKMRVRGRIGAAKTRKIVFQELLDMSLKPV